MSTAARRSARDTDAAELEHFASHRALTPAEFVATTERRFLQPRLNQARKTVGGTCRTCHSTITIVLDGDHPLVIATALRAKAKEWRDAAVFRDSEDDVSSRLAARTLRRLAARHEAKALRLEESL